MLAKIKCQKFSEGFWHRRRFEIAGILCVFQNAKPNGWDKRTAEEGQVILRVCPIKKGKRGECSLAPLIAPVSHRAISCSSSPGSGGQNLAALCTATSQNLTAIGSSHSLTETVNLGTMTTAGLIGTLHIVTPPNQKYDYARQSL